MRRLNARRGRAEVALAQIPTRDLDIAIVGQLPAADLSLRDQFEPGPMQMVGFQAPLRCRGLVKQRLEDPSRNPDDPVILAHADAELDHGHLGVPPGIRRKAEKHCDLLGTKAVCS
jgi:hypothetical protein